MKVAKEEFEKDIKALKDQKDVDFRILEEKIQKEIKTVKEQKQEDLRLAKEEFQKEIETLKQKTFDDLETMGYITKIAINEKLRKNQEKDLCIQEQANETKLN